MHIPLIPLAKYTPGIRKYTLIPEKPIMPLRDSLNTKYPRIHTVVVAHVQSSGPTASHSGHATCTKNTQHHRSAPPRHRSFHIHASQIRMSTFSGVVNVTVCSEFAGSRATAPGQPSGKFLQCSTCRHDRLTPPCPTGPRHNPPSTPCRSPP